MQLGISVEKVTKVSREYQGKTMWGVQFKGDWYDLYTPTKPVIGSFYPCEVTERQWNGKTYRDATPIISGPSSIQPLPPAAQNGTQTAPATQASLIPQPPAKPTLTAILGVIPRILSALPAEWAQDVQHARAYAQVLNTIIMAIKDGQVVIDEDNDAVEDDGTTAPWDRG